MTKRMTKAYWSVLKIFFNIKKIPLILLLLHKNHFPTDFKENAKLFNSFFADQCSLMRNACKLISNFTLYTNNLSMVTFSQENIDKTILNLNPNKANCLMVISIFAC